MPKFNVGDRVRFEPIEGEVTYVASTYGGIDVMIDRVPGFWNLPAELATVVVAPVKVGDVLTPGEGAEPPVGTVLIYVNTGESVRRNSDGKWYFAGPTSTGFPWSTVSDSDATVAYLRVTR